MSLAHLDGALLPASADLHVHLREAAMMELVTPTIRQGGVNTVMVMPNLVPPVTTVEKTVEYRHQLEALAPGVTFLMSLYLHPSLTPDLIAAAAGAGVKNVKSYPAGVTTNSADGVFDYSQFYPLFEAMQEHDMILNLHGETPSDPDHADGVTVLNAEEKFLPTLKALHDRFPRLRIVLEHCTTAAAIEAVKECGPTVAATITAHHLFLVVDHWAANPFAFCKPVAKTPADRRALVRAVVSGSEKFFFGSDSAPHPVGAKRSGDRIAAGVFTQPHVTQHVLDALELAVKRDMVRPDEVTVDVLAGFLSHHGRRFYRLPETKGETIRVSRSKATIEGSLDSSDGNVQVIPFRAGESTWKVEWQ